MNKMTKAGLLSFIDMCNNKGLVNAHTGGGRRAAATRILDDVDENEDLMGFDVHEAVMRFHNRNPGALSPSSLRTYEVRLEGALQDYMAWLVDPMGFKPSVVKTTGGEAKKPAKPTNPPTPTKPPATGGELAGQLSGDRLSMPFPMRPDFVAQITVPRDMSKGEAERLCAFVMALAIWHPTANV